MSLLLLLVLGFIAGTVGGVIGFGSSVMLMPPLVLIYGPRTAVPLMAVTALMTNLARVIVWWRELDWRVVAAYSITAVPAAALGARTLLAIPPRLADGVRVRGEEVVLKQRQQRGGGEGVAEGGEGLASCKIASHVSHCSVVRYPIRVKSSLLRAGGNSPISMEQ